MPSTLAQLRATLRQDLRDEDSAAYIWPDSVLNRHILHSVQLVQRARPSVVSVGKVMPAPAVRLLDLTADVPSTFLWLEAVEYPPGRWPSAFLPFREEAGPAAHLLSESLPPAGDSVTVWYARGYAVAESSSDLPTALEPPVLAGAGAFALADQSVDTAAKLIPAATVDAYWRQHQAALARFESGLARLTRGSAAPRWSVAWRVPE